MKASLGAVVVVMLGLATLQAASGSTNLSSSPHWAFIRPAEVLLPGHSSDHPIDAFVRAGLVKAGLKASPQADRATLIRRLSLDLVGLPPSAAAVREFVGDERPDAYHRLVDRLLASPHFGERWGRHWLDLARYADSDGYEKDTVRPYAYLYRDWVIDAVNRDVPFDQFTVEQLAGDLLPNATEGQRIATGFHRQTLINKEGGVDQEEYRCKATVDRTHTTGAVWLGLTLGCAECHDHKYDPIRQREFYQLYAFFNRASDADLPRPTPAEKEAYATARSQWQTRLTELEGRVAIWEKLTPTNADAPPVTNDLVRARQELEQHRKAEPKLKGITAMVLSAEERPTHVHVRGDFLRKGEAVAPGVPAILPPLKSRGPEPDRLDLARWLVAPENPLTARVTVNHVWRHLFGRGLVSTENDFGLRGERPSHPELLDWLALEFQRLGWSRKQLIRRIVTSATYRQSSVWRADLAQRDPLNLWLARQGRFRLEAEIVRDVALCASGLLNARIGGASFKPALPRDLANLSYANGLKWDAATGEERYRRGLYIHFQRTVPYPMLTSFDAPESTVTCTRRERSNSPLQALTLLNNELFVDCARALGQRMLTGTSAESPAVDGGIASAFESVTGRLPSRAERRRLREFWRAQYAIFAREPRAAAEACGEVAAEGNAGQHGSEVTSAEAPLATRATAVAVARVLLNLEETITRE